jgi:hypothetical protein
MRNCSSFDILVGFIVGVGAHCGLFRNDVAGCDEQTGRLRMHEAVKA